jgi:iron complex outermembrane receptor protein
MRGLRLNVRSAALFAGLLSAGAAVAPSASVAQNADAETPAFTGVEDIVVTAQKREEKLQDVPISITAITAQKLQSADVSGTLELGTVTPGLVATETGNSNVLFLRGVGTSLGTPGDEGSVNVVVDGVVYVSLPGEVFNFNNIERVEVLRGPQGTLFGRNASGGVINITTRDPQEKPSADVSVGYGTYNALTTSLYATSGIVDNLAGDIAVQYDNQSAGFGKNLYNGTEVNRARDFSIRSKLLWTPDDDTIVRLSGDYITQGGDGGIARRVLPGALGVDGKPGPLNFFDIDSNFPPSSFLRATGVNLEVEHNFPWFQVKSITADRSTISGYDFDQDSTALQVVDAAFHQSEQQFTEELQVASLPSSEIKWIFGGFFLDSSAKEDPLTLSGIAFAPVGGSTSRYGDVGTLSGAGYAQVTVPVGWDTNLTGGLRYTVDDKSFVYHETFPFPFIPTQSADTSKTFDKLTYRAEIDHKLSPDLLVYASVSTGFKSGSFNVLNVNNPPILPENLTAYETGVKSELFDRTLRLNVSGFYYDYTNIQVSEIVQGTTLFLNAGGGTDYGVDIDFDTASFRGLSLSGGAEFLRARYDDFQNAPLSLPNPATCAPVPMRLPGPLTGGNTICSASAAGNQFVHAPDTSLTLTATYALTTSIGEFGASATYAHTASYPWEPDNRLRQAPVDLVNAQLYWEPEGKRYKVRLFMKNVTNQHYYLEEASSLGDSGAVAPPRTFGAILSAHF